MSASEQVMHRMFSEIVAQYHPFAQYIGYQEGEDGFMLHYQGPNGQQYMIVDTEGNILGDTTMGTTRTMEVLTVGAAILSAFFGGQSNR
ncbi:hypothetical protein H6S82_11925 [Planktothrix sp. FACHB-1355]|uniref:Uncharacterized protein n=1 Tax=Aerosakkonema funiforme FACHB-1375 TaxID=2949571 RepID=A0A926VLB0_9CYAN|nr:MULTISPECIES: hypothetical protein [Oscillatoriales]MBD2184544.1 hypothetical protein [Aerosakkonema funiforme FACHB-1375]MBD3559567.1 hypothetical protein [Planktothrix sp. FACHB-1355]